MRCKKQILFYNIIVENKVNTTFWQVFGEANIRYALKHWKHKGFQKFVNGAFLEVDAELLNILSLCIYKHHKK